MPSALPTSDSIRCTFCGRDRISVNICVKNGESWNACATQECKEKINMIVKIQQELNRGAKQ